MNFCSFSLFFLCYSPPSFSSWPTPFFLHTSHYAHMPVLITYCTSFHVFSASQYNLVNTDMCIYVCFFILEVLARGIAVRIPLMKEDPHLWQMMSFLTKHAIAGGTHTERWGSLACQIGPIKPRYWWVTGVIARLSSHPKIISKHTLTLWGGALLYNLMTYWPDDRPQHWMIDPHALGILNKWASLDRDQLGETFPSISELDLSLESLDCRQPSLLDQHNDGFANP